MTSIWVGKKYIKLEHCLSPWYSTSNGRDICLKHYFTLWGWCLALRLVKTGYKKGVLQKAETMFGRITDILTNNFMASIHKEQILRGFNKSEIKGYSTMYCYNHEGDFLGSIDDLAWMFKYRCIADANLKGVVYSQKEKGYIGYSHRARHLFKIGDRLFDAKYVPKEEDYEKWEWAGFVKKQRAAQKISNRQDWRQEVLIEEVIPFRMRGSNIIKTPKEARKAAHNFSKDVS